MKLRQYSVRYKLLCVTSAADDLPNDGRTHRRVFRGTQQKNCFNTGVHHFIHLADTLFKFEISGSPKTTYDKFRFSLSAKVNRQPAVGSDFNPWLILKNKVKPGDPLFEREK